eukprot:NODE_1_length_95616_cov_0.657642.p72 type:complete len:127 gc:universal NODE_1_length_95616_cov_0.657642:38082-37702(-)
MHSNCNSNKSTSDSKASDFLTVHRGSKMKAVIEKAQKYLSTHQQIRLSASGKAINKVISIAEVLKRNNRVFQYNHLSSYSLPGNWIAQEPLDSIKVENHEPVFTITLSVMQLSGMDHCTEQTPAYL